MKTNRILALACVTLLAFSTTALAQAERPNIVYILVDNWGWGDIGVQGGTIPTPRIDALAAQGIRFTNFNVQNQCTLQSGSCRGCTGGRCAAIATAATVLGSHGPGVRSQCGDPSAPGTSHPET